MASPPIRIGTSSWSSPDWRGPFYPKNARPVDFLPIYATRFDTVECDSTFYGIPAARTVDGWRARTPEGFLFACKMPREITHDRGLVDCEEPLAQFLAKRRDPAEYATGDEFRARLTAFLEHWPVERELVVEVRNPRWVAPPLLDLLRGRGVGLVLPAIYTMPGPGRLFHESEPVTSNTVYVRFLGDHREMDELVARLRSEGRRRADWNELALDRADEMREWVYPLRQRAEAGARVLVYFNNHYAGYAPGSADQFRQLWEQA
jgi:uncharacterized protein YecE (DUF72 family)